jgi:hypothetical protein
MKKTVFYIVTALHFGASFAHAVLSDVTHQTMAEVIKIARAIAIVQPFLDDTKLMEYGLGIYRAAKKYDIDPTILIAIAQAETSFRENMAEGAAGEIGICQIRKMWLKHRKFKAEFKSPTLKDLKKPAKNFMMAAWILKDLKDRGGNSRTIPFWSYYNSVRFENRFKYFLMVNKHISKLLSAAKAQAKLIEAAKAPAEPAQQVIDDEEETPVAAAAPAQTAPQRAPSTASAPMNGRWISDAMQRLQDRPAPAAPAVRARPSGPTAENSKTYRPPTSVMEAGVGIPD